MTYEEFLDGHRAKALQVIKQERSRYVAASTLFQDYQSGMAALGLQALPWLDIGGRLIELDTAERGLDDEYSDTELNRARYDDLFARIEA